jgi:hypothetical protein
VDCMHAQVLRSERMREQAVDERGVTAWRKSVSSATKKISSVST